MSPGRDPRSPVRHLFTSILVCVFHKKGFKSNASLHTSDASLNAGFKSNASLHASDASLNAGFESNASLHASASGGDGFLNGLTLKLVVSTWGAYKHAHKHTHKNKHGFSVNVWTD